MPEPKQTITEEKRIAKVYRIVNPKGSIYVGSTIQKITNRWSPYKTLNCKEQSKLYNSLNKYGVDNHIFEIIWEGKFEQMYKMERTFGDYYNVLDRDSGLNLALPGYDDIPGVLSKETKDKIRESRAYLCKPNKKWTNSIVVNQYNLEGDYLDTFYNLIYVKQKFRLSNQGLKSMLDDKDYVYGDFIWMLYEGNTDNINVEDYPIKVDKYDLKGNYIETFKSTFEAAKSIGGKVHHNARSIRNCVKKLNRTSFGFIWKYTSEKFIPEKDRYERPSGKPLSLSHRKILSDRHSKAVVMYDEKGIKIREFKSGTEAAKHVGTTSSEVSRSCIVNNSRTKGYYFRYKESYNESTLQKLQVFVNPKKLRVKQICPKTLEVIKIWDSITEAACFLNGSTTDISAVCYGKRKTSKGFKWEHVEEGIDKRICQINKDNNELIKVWDDVKLASEHLNLEGSNIYATIKGTRRKSCGGFIWKYYSDYLPSQEQLVN